MFYETDLVNSIINNDLNKFKDLLTKNDVDPFAFAMDNIELCVKNERKEFIEFALKFTDKFEFEPTLFLEKVNKPEYNDILLDFLEENKTKINFSYKEELIIKNIIKNKNEELLIYIIKETHAYPFLNNNNLIVDSMIKHDMDKALRLIIKDIAIQDKSIYIAAECLSYKSFILLKNEYKLNVDYKNILKKYFKNEYKETDYSMKIVEDTYKNLTKKEIISLFIQTNVQYYYGSQIKITEKPKGFKLLLDYILEDKNNIVFLNDFFLYNIQYNFINNIKYLLTKSDLLIEEINKLTYKDHIKFLFNIEKELKYLYTYKDLCHILSSQEELEDIIYEIFKDKNFNKFIKKRDIINKLKTKKLKNVFNLSYNVNNF